MQLVPFDLLQNWWIPALAKFGAFLASNSEKIAKKFISQPKSKIFLGFANETILTTFWLHKDSCISFTSPSVEIFPISLLGQSSLKPLEIQGCQFYKKTTIFLQAIICIAYFFPITILTSKKVCNIKAPSGRKTRKTCFLLQHRLPPTYFSGLQFYCFNTSTVSSVPTVTFTNKLSLL